MPNSRLKEIENTQLIHILRGYISEIAEFFHISNQDAMTLILVSLPRALARMEQLPELENYLDDLHAAEEHTHIAMLINSVRDHIHGSEQAKRDRLAEELSHAYGRIAAIWFATGIKMKSEEKT